MCSSIPLSGKMTSKAMEPIPPRFIKVILQKTLDQHKLEIPVKFVRNHGEDLRNMANLKVSGGDSTWKMGLEECDGKVWLKKGWKEFAKYYSFAYEQFLVFEYRGKSDFEVIILGKNGAEPPHQDVEDSDIEILESCSFSRKKRERSPLPSPIPRKIIKADPTSKASAMERANAFKSQNAFFKAVMRESYVSNQGYLNIPYKFATKHFKVDRGKVILRVSNGTASTVNYAIDAPRARFCSSCAWNAFVKDNNLKVGDVCVFELVKDIQISFEVFIYRSNEGPNCIPSISKVGRGKKAVGKFVKGSSSSGVPEAAATKPYPLFEVLLKPSSFDSYGVYVPKSFAEKYVNPEKPEMKLQVGDSSWGVKLNCPANRIVTLSAGWMAFAKGNSLKVGDTCTFELIKGNVLRVSISRS